MHCWWIIIVRVAFDLPDWAIGRHISIFAGTELLAKMQYHRSKININGVLGISDGYMPIKIKATDSMRCNGCGDCCSTGGAFQSKEVIDFIRDRLNSYEYSNAGPCPMLTHEGCGLKGSIPFSCAKSNCEGWSSNCTEKLIQLEVM